MPNIELALLRRRAFKSAVFFSEPVAILQTSARKTTQDCEKDSSYQDERQSRFASSGDQFPDFAPRPPSAFQTIVRVDDETVWGKEIQPDGLD